MLMKATGIVRKLDCLGRIVLPKELRDANKLVEGSPMEVFVEGDDIIIRPYHPNCLFCGGTEDIVQFQEKNICRSCLNRMKAEE